MEFKGTKGKWLLSKSSLSIWHPINVGLRIVLVDEVIKDGIILKKESEANALLISKAPEMLEMLQMWCMDMEERGKAYGDCYTMTKQLIKEATELK